MLQFFANIRIPETTSQYPVSQKLFPQISRIPVIFPRISRIPKTPNGASEVEDILFISLGKLNILDKMAEQQCEEPVVFLCWLLSRPIRELENCNGRSDHVDNVLFTCLPHRRSRKRRAIARTRRKKKIKEQGAEIR